MKVIKTMAIMVIAMALIFTAPSMASEDATNSLDKSLQGLKFGILGYIDYSEGQKPLPMGEEQNYNEFALTRGYVTLEKKINPWLGARVTTDIHHESNGDYNVRLKYYYAKIQLPDIGPLTNIKSEVGMGHMPWLDFEEHINPYRCQGTMAVETAGLFNSSDLGVGVMGYFGGELENAEARTGSHYYTGRFGSWHIGVYNGPGYHGTEKNQNKVVEGRITLRPFFMVDFLSGLQLSYLGIYGDGNTVYVDENGDNVWPEYIVHNGMLSYQNPWVIFTGQYFISEGNAKGTMIYEFGEPLETMGYSFFGNVKLPVFNKRVNLFGRHDYFDADAGDDIAEDTAYRMYVGGVAIDLFKGNLLMVAYENTEYEKDSAGKKGAVPVEDVDLGKDRKFQVVLQVKF